MLFDVRDDHAGLVTSALLKAMEPVADELRMVGAADFITFIHGDKFANIQDIVSSSVELYFKPGTLSFGWGAELDAGWDRPPAVSLDMEFHHRSVWLIFKLILRALQTEVKVEHISLPDSASKQGGELALLTEAIADALYGSESQS